MPEPKKQTTHSKTRIRKGALIRQMKRAGLTSCTKCHEQILAHRVCPNCGYYKGEMIIDVLEKERKKKEKLTEEKEESNA